MTTLGTALDERILGLADVMGDTALDAQVVIEAALEVAGGDHAEALHAITEATLIDPTTVAIAGEVLG